MKDIYYKINNQIVSTQYGAAHMIDMKLNTFRSKIARAGGVDKINEIILNGHKVEIIRQQLTKINQIK